MSIDGLTNILIVDDIAENLVALFAVLDQPGWRILTAQSGAEALRYLLAEDVAVVLMDVRMPELDGLETASLIRQREKHKDMPIIFLTAMDSEKSDISRGYSAGAVDYIEKPFDPFILRSKVSVFVELHRKKEELALAEKKAFGLYEDFKGQAQQLALSNARLMDEIEGHKRARQEIAELHAEVERRSQQRLSLAQSAGRVGVFDWDVATGEEVWTPEQEEIFGFAPGTYNGRHETWEAGVHSDDLVWLRSMHREWLASGRDREHWEYRFIRPDGQERWISADGQILRESSRMPVRIIGTNVDVTNRKQAEEQIKASLAEKEVLLKEIHHRVKNNLQVISSLVSLQAKNVTDERTHKELRDVQDRVRSMALIHEKLYQTSDLARLNFAEYATSLLHSLWHAHSTLAAKTRLNFALSPVELPIEAAVPCGLILNELAGNALKHAFPNGTDGEVTVGLEHDTATDAVCLRVCDNGIGLPAGLDWRQAKSLGLQLVLILAGQLRGTVETETGTGTEFRVTFPLKGFQA